MRIGLLASTIVHLLIVAWVFGGIAWTPEPEPTEAIPVELVQAEPAPTTKPRELVLPKLDGEKSSASQGAETKASPSPEADKGADKPKGAAGRDQPEGGQAKAPPDEPPPPPPAEAPKAEAASGGAAPAEPPATPQPPPSIGAIPDLSPAEVAVLVNGDIGKSDGGGVVTSSLGQGLPAEQVDAVRAQAQRCWEAPSGWTAKRHATVTIRFRLNRDGSVDGTPVTIEGPASALGKAAADHAVLAIKRCGPYQLPAQSYDKWRVMELHFVLGG
jgi:hypothetical protein